MVWRMRGILALQTLYTKEAVKHVTHERRTVKNACIYNSVCNCKRMDVTYLTASLVTPKKRPGRSS